MRVTLRSPVREFRTPGSARGTPGNRRSYLNRRRKAFLMQAPQILMRLPCCLSAILMGCSGGTSHPITQTEIPRTDFVVRLYGPDSKGHYHYSLSDRSSVLIDRFLGPAQVGSPPKADLIDEGSERYRIRWGSGSGTAYTVIDSKHRSIVEDTNQANPANQTF